MLIIKSDHITIPRGISPSFVRTGDEKLQSKSVSITKNGNVTITPDTGYLGLEQVNISTNVTPNLENIIRTYTENGKYIVEKSSGFDGIGQATINIDIPKEEIKLQTKEATYDTNGSFTLNTDEGYDGISSVNITVNVPEKEIKLQSKTVTITKNSEYLYTYDKDYDGLKDMMVKVNVPEKKIILQNKEITENGTVTADSSYDGLGTVTVNVPIPEYHSQTKEVSYETNGSFTLKPDENYDGISKANITVNVPIPEYQSEQKTVTYSANGDYTLKPSEGKDGISQANITVNVPIPTFSTETKDVTYTKNGDYTINKSSDKDGITKATVHVNVPERQISLEEQTVDSSTLKSYVKGAQVFVTPHEGYDGLSKVTVNKLTFEGKDVVKPSTKQQVISPSTGYDGFDTLTIGAVDSTIDTNITPANIKKGVEILGVIGTYDNYVEPKLQEKTIDSSSLINTTSDSALENITPDEGYDGLSKVSITKVNLMPNHTTAVGSLPDVGKYAYFNPDSGYDGFKRFGFRINYQEPTIDPSTNSQTIDPSTGYACFKNVTVNPVTSSIDSNITADNIKNGVEILGVTGTYDNSSNLLSKLDISVTYPSDNKFSSVKFGNYDGVAAINYKTVRQDKTVDSSINSQVVTADSGYVGLKSVTVNPPEYTLLKYIQSDGACAYVLDSSALALEGFPKSYDTALAGFLCNNPEIEFNIDFTMTNLYRGSIFRGWEYDNNTSYLLECNDDTDVFFYSNIHDTSDPSFHLPYGIAINEPANVQLKLSNENYGSIYTNNHYIDSSTSPNSGITYSKNAIQTMLLFAQYNGNAFIYDTKNYANIQIHGIDVKIYDNKISSYHFIPVIHNGQVGFLETNSGTFCKNLGTGTPKYEIL